MISILYTRKYLEKSLVFRAKIETKLKREIIGHFDN
nr:MAG TPA: hypothetical protein [Caudoviricetes sp.]